MKEDVKPFSLATPRRIAVPLFKKVKKELDRMLELGGIKRVEEPTPWCSGMVVVSKDNGNVHICVDLTKLNEGVCRERCMLPSVDEILAQLRGAKIFSKLDANSGFWQIKLAKDSALLTTFITPYGRFCFNRVPFGITSAPEYFQRRMSQLVVICMIDDILVYADTQEEHDCILKTVLHKIEKEGGTYS